MTTYTLSQQQVDDITTQAGYVKSALTTIETNHPSYNLAALHLSLNSLALIGAYALGLPMTEFGGDGTSSSTTPQSGGTAKGGTIS